MIGLRHLRALVLLAEEGHFSRAAARLSLTQSAFSRRIQTLETALGARLVDRTTREVRLTPIGERFVVRVCDAMNRLDAAASEARAEAAGLTGLLRIGYNKFALNGPLIGIIHHFRDQVPDVRIDLLFTPSGEQLVEIHNGVLDLGTVIGPAPPDFDSLTLQRERLVAIVPSRHRFAGRDIAVSDLADESFVFGRLDTWRLFRAIVDRTCVEAGFIPHIVQDAATEEAVFGLVATGVGITLTVEGSVNTRPQGLAVANLVDCPTRIETVLVWQRSLPAPQTERFLTVARALVARPGGRDGKGGGDAAAGTGTEGSHPSRTKRATVRAPG